VSALSVKPPPTPPASLLSAQRRATIDEQLGRACAGSMDSSPASTPRRGGRPQGVGRATLGATEKPTLSTFHREHLNAANRFQPPSRTDVATTSFASSVCTSSAQHPRRRPPGGNPHQRPTRPTRTTVEEPSGELLSSHCPQNLGATSLSCTRRRPRPPRRRSWLDLARASPVRHGERAPLLRPWTGRQRVGPGVIWPIVQSCISQFFL
jgi:hypothetical protein